MVVSPTYFGACADVAALAAVAHARGVPLVVDEAWGAHLHFHPDLPADALACGADLVTSSTHKIVGSLTQAAMLHLGGGGRIDARGGRPLRQPGRDDQPQRPALRLARRRPPPGLRPRRASCSARRWRRSPTTREEIEEIPGLDVLDERMVGRPGIAGWDPLRLAIDVRGTGSTGYRLAKAAFYDQRASTSSSTPRTSSSRSSALGEPAAAAGERLVAGAAQGGRRSWRPTPGAPDEKLAPPPPWGELVMTPREAFLGPQEVIPFDAAAGRDRRRGRSPPTRPGSPTSSPASG